MKVIQLNIPDEVETLLKSVPVKTEDFIIDAVKKRLKEIRDREIEKLLIEGYKSSKKEAKQLTKEFETIDMEDWDEY
jgi:hypothetical protein